MKYGGKYVIQKDLSRCDIMRSKTVITQTRTEWQNNPK